ncbi:hypothetical protein B296_00038158 [Ensete ventricosum]|uniref:Uncharacterized protein n=1 Tax=Ensete ventricosum TaxID=4639 RepID=A0A426Y6Q1_ENSVE|nr:hypothetical protein B296_00038158 [Ensete ventricosum]
MPLRSDRQRSFVRLDLVQHIGKRKVESMIGHLPGEGQLNHHVVGTMDKGVKGQSMIKMPRRKKDHETIVCLVLD